MSRFKKGDRVLVHGNPPGINVGLPWPFPGIVIANGRRYQEEAEDWYSVDLQVTDPKLAESLARQHLQMPLRLNVPAKLISRDKICPVCKEKIDLNGPNIDPHGKNGLLCYGSHQPLEMG